MGKRKTEATEGQGSLFDLSHYTESELTGSFSDDFEPELFVKRKGKKSKIDPTWDMTDQEYQVFREAYRDNMVAIIARYPVATAPPPTATILAARSRAAKRRRAA
jgi:hypothetical protein